MQLGKYVRSVMQIVLDHEMSLEGIDETDDK